MRFIGSFECLCELLNMYRLGQVQVPDHEESTPSKHTETLNLE